MHFPTAIASGAAVLSFILATTLPAVLGPASGAALAQERDGPICHPYRNGVVTTEDRQSETSNHIAPRHKTQDVYDHLAQRFYDEAPEGPVVVAVRRVPPPVTRRRTPRPFPVAVDLPEADPDEILVIDLNAADRDTAIGQGFTVLEEVAIPGLGVTVLRLEIPAGISLTDARSAIQALPSGAIAGFNHYYRAVQGAPGSTERTLVGWPLSPPRETTCGSGVEIGMIDSGINENHATFAGARLEVIHLPRTAETPSGQVHGTGVAALLVGNPASRSPGLLPGARLIAVDAFYRDGTDERTDVLAILEALGLLVERGVRVINLSLAGPDNTVLAAIIGELTLARNITVVAAVGNDGADAAPAYPAAYGPVLAVTAVDGAGRIYQDAIRGEHVDISAPGVNVWTAASIKGARWKTGTSFAVPFVTAAAALLTQANPDMTVGEIAEVLRNGARDLGTPGFDPDFGAGLLNLGSICDPTL